MSRWRTIFMREFLSYINSPIIYIFVIVFVLFICGMYMTQFFLAGHADMRYFFGLLPMALCVFISAVTMRIWAEEKKGNTFELLLTFPMKTHQLVFGKFAAAFLFYLTALMGTIFVPVMLFVLGKPDPGPIVGGYLGAVLIGAFFLSIGIFISGLCRDQIVSFITAMIVCFFFYLSGHDFMASLIDGWLPGVGTFFKENFGMARHFAGFEKGVIDNRDVLYFCVMSTVFLVLNIFAIDDRLRPKAKLFFSAAAGICLMISMVFNALMAGIPLGRYDLTEGKIYTVTESAKNILRSLHAPAAVKLYISPAEKMPTALKTLEQEIRDQLDELKILSQGKFSYNVFHMEASVPPSPTPEKTQEETLAGKLQEKGIAPFQVQSIERDEVGIRVIYAAMTIAYKDKEEEIIPRIIPQNLHNLEYELISKIYRMTLASVPKVALMAPYTQQKIDPQIVELMRKMGQQASAEYREDNYKTVEALFKYEDYDVKRILLTQNDPLPDAMTTLVILAPEDLNERQRYEINRFLYEGGNVILAAQPYEYDYRSSGPTGVEITPRKKQIGVNELLKEYGVTIHEDLLMDERHEVLTLSGAVSFGPFAVSLPVKAPMHILVVPENMNQEVSITGRMSSLVYFWGAALKFDEERIKKAGLKKMVLFTSSEQSWTVPFPSGPLDKAQVDKGAAEGYDGPQPLAVLLEGQFPNVFENKAAPAWPKEETAEAAPEAAAETEQAATIAALNPKPGKLIVVGNSKMFEEDYINKSSAPILLVNAVDALSLGSALINIRSHQPIDRSIRIVGNMTKLWYRFMTILLVPILMVGFGGTRAVLRRREKEDYIKSLPDDVE